MTFINDSNYPRFKRQYTAAVSSNSATFTFNGNLVLTAYAKYVCEYYDNFKGGSDGECESDNK